MGYEVGVLGIDGMLFVRKQLDNNCATSGVLREMENALGGIHTSDKVNTSVEYTDGLHESCCVPCLLASCAQLTGEPTLTPRVFCSQDEEGLIQVRLELLHVLLFCSYRVYNRGGDSFGWDGIYVKTV